MRSLDLLETGKIAFIKDLIGDQGFISRASATGFTPGTQLKMVQNFRKGPLIVFLRDTQVALGRKEAKKIMVRNKKS